MDREQSSPPLSHVFDLLSGREEEEEIVHDASPKQPVHHSPMIRACMHACLHMHRIPFAIPWSRPVPVDLAAVRAPTVEIRSTRTQQH